MGSTSGDLVPTLFYCEVRRREDKSNLDITVSNAILSTLLHSAVNDTKDVTSMCLRDFIKRHLSESKVQRMEYTKAIANPLIAANFPVESTVVSSSHVIRAYVGKDEAERMAMKFLETLPSEKLKR